MPAQSAMSSAPADPLVGRQDVLERLLTVVDRPGIVTVTGPGGVGKTRVVRALLGQLPHPMPTTVVELDYAPTPAGLVEVAARALVGEAYSAPDALAAVASVVRDADHVLVLDGIAPDVHESLDVVALRDACPRLRIVLTALRRLGVSGEQLVDVAPLTLPAAHDDPWRSPAMALLADHLARAGHTVRRDDPEETGALMEICRRAGGVPLALELVAGWAPVYAPVDIAALVGSSLDLFSGGGPDRPERQRDLRALIELSVRHLDDEQRTVLATVAAVPGGVDHALLADLCGPRVPLVVRALVERHLVTGAATAGRFDMLEPVRLFVERELAGAFDAARAALAERVVADVLDAGPLVGTVHTTEAVRRLVMLQALHRPTVARLAASGDHRAIDVVEELTAFWLATARISEGEDTVAAARPAARDEADRARLAIVRATLLNHRHDEPARDEAERALTHARAAIGAQRVTLEARARLALARARWIEGDEAGALATLDACAPLDRLPPTLRRRIELELAIVHHNAGDEAAAEKALHRARGVGGDDDLRTQLDAAGLQLAVRVPDTGLDPAHIEEASSLLARCDWPFLEQARLRFWVSIRQIAFGDLEGATRTLEPARRDGERTGSAAALRMTHLALAVLHGELPNGAGDARHALIEALDVAFEYTGPVSASLLFDFALHLAPVLDIRGDDLRALCAAALPLFQAGDHGLIGTVRRSSIVDAVRAAGLDDADIAQLRALPVSATDLLDRLRWLRALVARADDTRPLDPRLATLSARELEILQLVALGRSDQDIADELVVGLRTVNTHVANIRRKLGAPNRRAAGALYRDATS